jgi:hypothetical protein
MATETAKVLAQANPAATTLTAMYTVPASTATVVSTLVVANRSTSNIRVRVSVAVAGAADSNEQYILYDALVLKQDSNFYTLGITLAATDVVRVYTDAAEASFSLFGVEVA